MNNTINIAIDRLDISIPYQGLAGQELPAIIASTIGNAAGFAEVRDLGNGERISQEQMLKELAALGDGWRIESPHELFAKVRYDHKNGNGAYSLDETIKDGYYWTDKPHPEFEGGRVVVGFDYGYVYNDYGNYRAFARAVRVSGQ